MKHILTIIFLFALQLGVKAQLDSVIVEKYYISNSKDSTDIQYILDEETGDPLDTIILKKKSVTYRIYVQVRPGYVLQSVFANKEHQLSINSTDYFYNYTNNSNNTILGKDIRDKSIPTGKTLGLDSWLTIGLAARAKIGVLKSDDSDGSIINGQNGFLVNDTSAIGFPLTERDGYADVGTSQVTISNYGLADSTIFGSIKKKKGFESNNFSITTQTKGINFPKNRILIAQLTTRGELTFKLNVLIADTSNINNRKYFVADTVPGDYSKNTLLSRYLTYPLKLVCGCNDKNFWEYMPNRDCDDPSQCKRKVILGCTDPLACNFNPDPNVKSVPSLCCYPGRCADRDISVVCPDLGKNTLKSQIKLYPNPVESLLTLEINDLNYPEKLKVDIFNTYGTLKRTQQITLPAGSTELNIDLSEFDKGIYMIRVSSNRINESKMIIKSN